MCTEAQSFIRIRSEFENKISLYYLALSAMFFVLLFFSLSGAKHKVYSGISFIWPIKHGVGWLTMHSLPYAISMHFNLYSCRGYLFFHISAFMSSSL